MSKKESWLANPKSEDNLPTSAFDYDLPRDRIARYPAERRDESKLMVLDRARSVIEHRRFRDIVEYMQPGDALVLNETRVFPARLIGRRETGGKAEVFLLHADERGWQALVYPGARLKPGKFIEVAKDLRVEIVDVLPNGNRIVRLHTSLDIHEALERYGHVPLPPYMNRQDEELDRERYQTVFAREPGSVAAPTAGLHFTPELLRRIESKGIQVVKVVLHVGVGTFRPIEVENPDEHVMHEEPFSVSAEAAAAINTAQRVWAVGTTVTRTLESIAADHGTVRPGSGATNLFIRPGYQFKVVDKLITNFHLPKSTLMMLVSAFGGYEFVMRAYQEAIVNDYRFYSYGDAMALI